ncbi:MAG TPA: hypothetical protein EYG66_00110 [Mariprofundaceae bacterium]|nr:hypothetical protein [Mariprofundaceae bacterium]
MNKKILTSLAVAGLFTGLSSPASASSGFESTVNQMLGNGASVSCNACHTDGGSTSSATRPMANTYRAARAANDFTLIATSDSDGDGYINKFEVNAATVEFNVAATSPFTKATGVNAVTTLIKTLADIAAVSAAFADPNGLAGVGKEILGGIKVTLNQVDTIYFKAGGVSSTDTVYTVDAAGVETIAGTADWMATVDGGLQVINPPAGGFPVGYVVIRSVPVVAALPTNTQVASVTGCVTSSVTTPLMMVFALLSLGFFARRKKVNQGVES